MFSMTKVSDGTGETCYTYNLIDLDGKIQKFSCWKGETYFIGNFYQGKWKFYSAGKKTFPLPENIRKKFAEKGKIVE